MSNRMKAQCKAKGGRVAYSGGASNTAKEADSDANMKRGGSVDLGEVDGNEGKSRIKKARGGGVGSDKSPFSSAGGGGASKHPFSSAHRG